MKRMFMLLLLMHALSVTAQRVPYADSLLLDAQYDKIIAWADAEEQKSPNDVWWITQIATRKVEALVRLGKFEEAERVLKSLGVQQGHPAAQAAVDIAYGSLFLNEGWFEQADARLEAALTQL